MNMRWAGMALFAGALAFILSACLTIRHGSFTAASSRPVKEEAFSKGNPVRGRDCVELDGWPIEFARIGKALDDALSKIGDGRTLIIGASVGIQVVRPGSFSEMLCAYVVGTAASPVSPDATSPSGAIAQVEVDPFPLVHFNTGDMGLITSAPITFPAESLGEKVTGKNCSWYVFFIPVNHLAPHLDGAIADALQKAGPDANLLLDGTINATSMTSVLVGSGCFEVTATPAHSDLVE